MTGTAHSPREKVQLVSSAVAPFLASLFEILSKEDTRVIGWCEDGKSFGVYDYEAMEQNILPTYFRHNKYASFQRQLNYFGFRKLHKAKDTDQNSVYCQPYFVKHDPSRMLHIKRKTHRVKANTPRRTILGAPISSDGFIYPSYHHSYGMDTPMYTPSGAQSPAYYQGYNSTPTSCTEYDSPKTQPSNDAYDPLPFYRPSSSTDIFLVQAPSVDPTVDINYNPFIPVHPYPSEPTNEICHGNMGSTSENHPIPYSETTRESIKLSSDDLNFLYDETLCI